MLAAIHNNTLRAIKAVVYTLWPATTWAAQITLGNTLATVPALAWLMVFILSTVSGLAALLNRPPRLPSDRPSGMAGAPTTLLFLSASAPPPPPPPPPTPHIA